MDALGFPDQHFLNAASGWFELGCRTEAVAELAMISWENAKHPDVLELRWALLAEAEQWEAALDVAGNIILRAPNRPSGWLNRAYAMRRTSEGGLQKAWDALLPAAEQFPTEPTICYNLSCYACQMMQYDTARQWLQRAIQAGDRDNIKRMALADSDLKPMWEEIKGF